MLNCVELSGQLCVRQIPNEKTHSGGRQDLSEQQCIRVAKNTSAEADDQQDLDQVVEPQGGKPIQIAWLLWPDEALYLKLHGWLRLSSSSDAFRRISHKVIFVLLLRDVSVVEPSSKQTRRPARAAPKAKVLLEPRLPQAAPAR